MAVVTVGETPVEIFPEADFGNASVPSQAVARHLVGETGEVYFGPTDEVTAEEAAWFDENGALAIEIVAGKSVWAVVATGEVVLGTSVI